jgi:hypothetical protein
MVNHFKNDLLKEKAMVKKSKIINIIDEKIFIQNRKLIS